MEQARNETYCTGDPVEVNGRYTTITDSIPLEGGFQGYSITSDGNIYAGTTLKPILIERSILLMAGFKPFYDRYVFEKPGLHIVYWFNHYCEVNDIKNDKLLYLHELKHMIECGSVYKVFVSLSSDEIIRISIEKPFNVNTE